MNKFRKIREKYRCLKKYDIPFRTMKFGSKDNESSRRRRKMVALVPEELVDFAREVCG